MRSVTTSLAIGGADVAAVPSCTTVARPLVYVAAAYSEPDPVANTHEAIRVADRLVEDGVVTPLVPHLTLVWQLVSPRPLDFWYAYDLAILERCDALLRLEGTSSGADREVEHALHVGIPTFLDVPALYAWAEGWNR